MALTDKLTAIGNAIRGKTGGSALLTLDQMPTEIASIQTGKSYDDIAQHNYSGIITLPTATKIGACCFSGSNITEIHAPNVTSFNSDNQTNGLGVFQNCKSLVVVDIPKYTNSGSGGYQFAGCSALTTVYFPLGMSGQYMFYNCSNLVTAVIGSSANMNGNDFNNCSKLEAVDTKTGRVHTSSFYNCAKLTTLIIRRGTVPTLTNINAFNNTPFASGKAGGILYVPESLISSYQSATNWSTILGYPNNQIKKIEGTIYATQYADGTPIN